MVEVPCGKCVNCINRKAAQWGFRLMQEVKRSTSACFLTFTYDDQNLKFSENGYPTLYKKDYQDFVKRLRKKHTTSNKENRIKYYAVGEYGDDTHRPHYHAIMFNLPKNYITNIAPLNDVWQNGFIHFGNVKAESIRYVTGYMNKEATDYTYGINDDRAKQFSIMSKNIGDNWLTPAMIDYYRSRKSITIVKENGELMSMPRYYKQKIFNQLELNIINKDMQAIFDEDFTTLVNKTHDRHEHVRALIRKNNINKQLKRKTI